VVFSYRNRHRVIVNEFPVFVVGGSPIKFVNQFKYLGHIVTDVLSDDDDILREVKNLFLPIIHHSRNSTTALFQ